MDKLFIKLRRRLRLVVQVGFTALTNANFRGFVEGRIYTGDAKLACVPGLNCYSCPGALGACPIGSLQAVLGSPVYRFSCYVVGLIVIIGAALGRFVCGWLCPFGLVQDLIYKIPFFRKYKLLPGDKYLKYLKYAILLVFVLLLPLFAVDGFGQGAPYFCKLICPAGTLGAALPLVAVQESIRTVVGGLFWWKFTLLVAILVLSLLFYRPFCRYLCPLGAIYSFFNPIALYRYRIDKSRCTSCGACQRACKFDISVYQSPNSPDCIRCGDCRRACPTQAIQLGLSKKRKEEKSV